ncbi:MAG: beta-N-acetylglucosaminidase domain-containing protein [Phocaeicola sp.]
MKRINKMMLAVTALALTCTTLHAQEEAFDLSSQRSESQDVLRVPGKKLDHQGLIINPTPQSLIVNRSQALYLPDGIALIDKKQAFTNDFGFIAKNKKAPKLTIDFGSKLAEKSGVKAVSGAYALRVTTKGISIIGYDEIGAFYGIQTLRQIIANPEIAGNLSIPTLEIIDHPDMKYRGIVEGFYGPPWSHEVRLSLIDFYGQFKMNSYLYGPKDDHYHSSPHWRLPYPEKEAKDIKELVEACNRNRVEFVWAIHPGKDIKWNEEDYQNLVKKFEMMYDLGVRSYAIFFDDIEGEGTNPVKQTELLNRLNKEFVEAKGNIANLVMCPTDYSRLWANPTEKGSLVTFGNKLDKSIEMFYTGDVVCSDLTKETMDFFNSRVKRPGYFWWNYPVTDYVRHIIMQGPVYGLDTSLTPDDIVGLASNPMEHGEASKLALYSVADYTWNLKSYNAIDSWERGLAEIAPTAKEAYRTFAIHSCDTENGYRRSESWETETFRINNYTQPQFKALATEFEKVEKVYAIMSENCENELLKGELQPWLVEFEKLGKRGKKALDLIQLSKTASDKAFWNSYTQNLMSETERKAYNEHKSGTMKLQPFYENTMDDLAFNFYTKLTGEVPSAYLGIGSFPSLQTIQCKLMFDNDTTTHYTSGVAQKTGDWIGADLRAVREVSTISIIQGRNSVDDVDYFDHTILEYSVDGKTWNALTDELEKCYIIEWNGEPVQARYVRIRKLPSKKTNWSTVRTFKVNPFGLESLGFAIEATDTQKALYAFDKNPGTSFTTSNSFGFGVSSGKRDCTMLTKRTSSETVKIEQLAINGAVLAELTVDSDFIHFEIDSKATTIKVVGVLEIFEIIVK